MISGVVDVNRIARLDHHLDDFDVVEIADVGNLDVDQCAHRLTPSPGLGFSGSMSYFLIAAATREAGICSSSASALQRRERDVVAIDLEEAAQALAIVTAAEAVGAEHAIAARHVGANLIGEGADIVSRRDHRPRAIGEAGLDVTAPLRLGRMQHVPALDLDARRAAVR